MEKATITVENAAEILGIDPQTVSRLARLGKIPAIKVGRLWRMRESTLRQWMENQEKNAMVESPRHS